MITQERLAEIEEEFKQTHFHCPKCGSTWFGSSFTDIRDDSTGTIYCHDEFQKSCHWRGPYNDTKVWVRDPHAELIDELIAHIHEQNEVRKSLVMELGYEI